MAARKAKIADQRLDEALESAAAGIAALIAAAAYDLSLEIASWPQESREGFDVRAATEAPR